MKGNFLSWAVPKWVKEIRHDDVFVKDPKPSDLVIVIMGATGSGKSTFINTLFGQDNLAPIGHGLESYTSVVQAYHLTYPKLANHRIMIVDTPGFDDTFLSDREILSRIGVWLAHSYQFCMKLAGIVYLHDISQIRWQGSNQKNFEIFEKLCGPAASRKVILLTTMWDKITEEEGERHEQDLRDVYWEKMLAQGSVIRRAGGIHDQLSAQGTVDCLLASEAPYALQIQQDLVENNKALEKTKAGRHLSQMVKDSEDQARALKFSR